MDKTPKKEPTTPNGEAKRLANLRPPWKKGQCGNPKGRPKSKARDILRRLGADMKAFGSPFSASELREIDRWICSTSAPDLTTVASNADAPIYIRVMASAMVADAKEGRITTLEKIQDRLYGKPKASMELSGRMSFEDYLKSTEEQEDGAD